MKKLFLHFLQNSLEKTLARASFLIQKEILTQVFSCATCAIFKSNYYVEHQRTTAKFIFFNETTQNFSNALLYILLVVFYLLF